MDALSRDLLQGAGLGLRAMRFTKHLGSKLLEPRCHLNARRPYEGRSFAKKRLNLGKIFLPFRELRLSKEAAPCIRKALLSGRDFQAECKPTGASTVARSVVLFLAFKIRDFWQSFHARSLDGLKASLKSDRRSRAVSLAGGLFFKPLP